MAKNASASERFEVKLSWQSVRLLQELASRGVYGRSAAEVGGRLIDQALQGFVERPSFKLDLLGNDGEQK